MSTATINPAEQAVLDLMGELKSSALAVEARTTYLDTEPAEAAS